MHVYSDEYETLECRVGAAGWCLVGTTHRQTPMLAAQIAELCGPDELVHGTATGKPPFGTIPLGNRTRRQTLITEYFR